MARSGILLAVALVPILGGYGPSDAADHLLAGRVVVVKPGKLAKAVLEAPATLPATVTSGALRLSDGGAPEAGDLVFDLSQGEWKALGKPPGAKGFRYRGTGAAGDPCRAVVLKPRTVKFVCRGADVALTSPPAGDLTVALEVGGERYCAAFGGLTVRADGTQLKRTDAPAPAACPSPAPVSCRQTLDALGVTWAGGPAVPGIADPVTVTFPLNGIAYDTGQGVSQANAVMDCRLV